VKTSAAMVCELATWIFCDACTDGCYISVSTAVELEVVLTVLRQTLSQYQSKFTAQSVNFGNNSFNLMLFVKNIKSSGRNGLW